jgi:hypothetical protein
LASGDYAHAEATAQATGNYSHAEGHATASGLLSHAEGTANAYMDGMHAHAGGAIGGATQFSRVVRSQYGNSSNPVDLNDSQNQPALIFPDYFRCALLDVRVVARRHDLTSAVSAWRAECIVEGDGSGDFRFVGSPAFTLIAQDASASSWSVADLEIRASDHHHLIISASGQNGVGIYWHATIELHELT